MVSYQDIYPSPAILRSFDIVRPRAAELLNLEYFEAEPIGSPTFKAAIAPGEMLLFDQRSAGSEGTKRSISRDKAGGCRFRNARLRSAIRMPALREAALPPLRSNF